MEQKRGSERRGVDEERGRESGWEGEREEG